MNTEPSTIVGTSVGAINGLLPAQSIRTGATTLRDVWYELRNEHDMYSLSPEAEEIENRVLMAFAPFSLGELAKLVLSEPPTGIDTYDPEPPTVAKKRKRRLLTRGIVLGVLGGPLNAGGYFYLKGKASVERIMEGFERLKSIYSLEPLRQRLYENVNSNELARSNITLRMVSVALETGNTCFIDQNARYGEIRGANNLSFHEPQGRDIDLIIKGALASAAIPGAFEPMAFYLGMLSSNPGDPAHYRTCVDGGVRDLLPSRALNDIIYSDTESLHEIVAVYNQSLRVQAPLPTEHPIKRYDNINGYIHSNVLDIASRSLSISQSEVSRSDMMEPCMRDPEITKHIIHPDYQVTGTAQIDPGLVRINWAYGWMTAFETMNRKRFRDKNPDELRGNCNEISMYRLACWIEEHRFFDLAEYRDSDLEYFVRPTPAPMHFSIHDSETTEQAWMEMFARMLGFENAAAARAYAERLPQILPETVRRIRDYKRKIRDLMDERVERWGIESLPNERALGYSLNTWFQEWEKHQFDVYPSIFGQQSPWEAAFGEEIAGFQIERVPEEPVPDDRF